MQFKATKDAFCFVAERGFGERLLRAAQKVLGRRLRLSEQWLRTTSMSGVEFASGAAFEVTVASCFKL